MEYVLKEGFLTKNVGDGESGLRIGMNGGGL